MLHASRQAFGQEEGKDLAFYLMLILYFAKPLTIVNLSAYIALYFNPFTPRSDQHINSSYNFNTLSSRQVMRIKKIIN